MSEKQLKELGYRLTGLNVRFDNWETTALVRGFENKYININYLEIKDGYNPELQDRGFNKLHVVLQALLHEVAHYKQFLKYGKGGGVTYNYLKYLNEQKGEKVADRFALMYYRRFVENAIYT